MHGLDQRVQLWGRITVGAPPRPVHQHDRAGAGLVGCLQVLLQPAVLCGLAVTPVAVWQLFAVDVQRNHVPGAQTHAVIPPAALLTVRIQRCGSASEVCKITLGPWAPVFMVAQYRVGDVLEASPGPAVIPPKLGQRADLVLQISQHEYRVWVDLLDQIRCRFLMAASGHPASTVVADAVWATGDVSSCSHRNCWGVGSLGTDWTVNLPFREADGHREGQ